MKYLYQLLVQGNQKAIIGFIVSGALGLFALVGISGDMTVKEALTVLGTAIVTGISVFYTRNK